MPEDGRIYITITDNREGNGPSTPGVPTPVTPTTPTGSSDSSQKKDNVLGAYIQHQFFNLVKQTVTKVVNNSIGNIGNYTGNYALQDEVNLMMGTLSDVRDIGLSVAAGATMGGPIGAIVAGAGAIIGKAVSFGIKDANDRFAVKKQNMEIERIRIRSGLNTSYNESRGTEG